MAEDSGDKPLTKRELGGWFRVAVTVIPIVGTILATTWALASQSKDSELRYRQLEAEQARIAIELKKHSDILEKVPQLEVNLVQAISQLKEHERWTRRLNDVLIRVETKLGMERDR